MEQKKSGKANNLRLFSRIIIVRGLLAALVFVIFSTIILTYQTNSADIFNLKRGHVSPVDIDAPRQIVYTSQLKTEQERERAKNSVDIIYNPPDPKVARTQVRRLEDIFSYLEAIRADSYARDPQRAEWVRAIPDLTLSDRVVDDILLANDQSWKMIVEESARLLNTVLRREIREYQVNATRGQLLNQIPHIPEEEAQIIIAIIGDLIKANTFADYEATQAKKETAAESVKSVAVTIEENERIVSAGQIVGDFDIEKLRELGLQKSQFTWLGNVIAPGFFMFLTTVMVGIYLIQYAPNIIINNQRLYLLVGMLLTFLTIAKGIIPYGAVSIYLYPIAALSMMTVVLIDIQLAFILTPIVAMWVGYLLVEDVLPVFIYILLSGWAGALALNKGRRLSALIWGGVYVVLINISIITIFAFAMPNDLTRNGNLFTALFLGALNGIVSAGFTLIGSISIGRLLGITTAMQLVDLQRPNHPLLKKLLLNAPGTYHHSLMVSNLAEQAAERIGADALLVRVMAYYHDIGKMQRPYFFVENQPEGVNVHEKLDPKVSAQIIISHATDGLELAKKYRLPKVIQDGIIQHHGTTLVKYFYYQAMKKANETNEQINEENFQYPGPRPQNKENGILMLADVTESVVRALKPGSAQEIDEIVQKMIAEKLETGQLNECDLTIADLHKIREAFVDMLQGVHHPRIKYPDPVKPKQQLETTSDNEQETTNTSVEEPPSPTPSSQTTPVLTTTNSSTSNDIPSNPKQPAITPPKLNNTSAQPTKLVKQE